jgi:4,5-DOPA dioxygenase extradiol
VTQKRMPLLFIGHGSPMNAIEDNAFRRRWQALGGLFGEGKTYAKPKAILCVSAHWLTRGSWVTAMEKPQTIHDFGGFPQALFDVRYPAPGAPTLAGDVAKRVAQTSPCGVTQEWGFDHGTWSVLHPMFPAADIPVLQLSIDVAQPPSAYYRIGQQLQGLRDEGVLILGSGNVVHNLRTMRNTAPFDWAHQFDAWASKALAMRDDAALIDFASQPHAALAHPTPEHYWPLLFVLGAAHGAGAPAQVGEGWQMASVSMRSVQWG